MVQVSCGWRHTAALTERANVFTWGRATNGQLGVGDTEDRSVKGTFAVSMCWNVLCFPAIREAVIYLYVAQQYAAVLFDAYGKDAEGILFCFFFFSVF